jgi:hypothetical protein
VPPGVGYWIEQAVAPACDDGLEARVDTECTEEIANVIASCRRNDAEPARDFVCRKSVSQQLQDLLLSWCHLSREWARFRFGRAERYDNDEDSGNAPTVVNGRAVRTHQLTPPPHIQQADLGAAVAFADKLSNKILSDGRPVRPVDDLEHRLSVPPAEQFDRRRIHPAKPTLPIHDVCRSCEVMECAPKTYLPLCEGRVVRHGSRLGAALPGDDVREPDCLSVVQTQL